MHSKNIILNQLLLGHCHYSHEGSTTKHSSSICGKRFRVPMVKLKETALEIIDSAFGCTAAAASPLKGRTESWPHIEARLKRAKPRQSKLLPVRSFDIAYT